MVLTNNLNLFFDILHLVILFIFSKLELNINQNDI